MRTDTLSVNRIEAIRPSDRMRVEQQRDAPVGYHDELNIGPCVLVSREMGSGGSQIANQVAQRLGWEILDKEILDKLASQYGTPRVVLDAVDEKKVGWLLDLLNGWIEGHGFSQLSYVNRLGRLFNTVAKCGNVVIVGRGAKFLLPNTAGISCGSLLRSIFGSNRSFCVKECRLPKHGHSSNNRTVTDKRSLKDFSTTTWPTRMCTI